MAHEKFERAEVGQFGRRRVEMRPADAGEGVILTGVIMKSDKRVVVQRRVNWGLRLGRAVLILLREVQHQRIAQISRLVERVLDAYAVIADAAFGMMANRQ